MTTHEGAPRALRLVQRIDRLGIPDRELARRSGVSRNTVKAARNGTASSVTYGKLERTLDAFEQETGADQPDDSLIIIELTDGTRVTFRNVSAQFVADFLERRSQEDSA